VPGDTAQLEKAAESRGTDLPGDEAVPEGEPPRRSRSWVRSELLAALEICGLTGLAFTRPILDSFGRAPETLLARDAAPRDVVLFALAVAIVPALAVVLVTTTTRLLGRQVRRWTHLAAVGGLFAVVVWRFGTDVSSWARPLLVAAAVVGGIVLAVLRCRVRSTATYLRLLGAASVVFLAQFLLFSPSSTLAFGGRSPTVDGEAADAVLAGTDGDPPPIVMVVVDALPTGDLLDGTGSVDAELYPNLAALVDDSTWYRNHSTMAGWTYQAVPAMLSGVAPEHPGPLPDARAYPDNLFTLFAGTHDIEAVEQITRLCPTDACPRGDDGALGALLGDAVDWWRGALDTGGGDGAQLLPGALEPDRADEFVTWVDDQDFSAGGDPGLWFYHLVLPHDPWVLLDDLGTYDSLEDEPYGLYLHGWWGDVGADVARQRQVLQTQAADRALGQLFDELRAAGTYDESLIVVAGDHGQAFLDNHPLRGLAAEQYEQVTWTPFIVKAPGQTEPVVDDTNLWAVDEVPTIAETLGIDLPWDLDGVAAGEAGEARDPGDKRVVDSQFHDLEPPEGSDFVELDGREGLARVLATDPVAGSGEHAVWQRTEYGALVGRDVGDLDVRSDEAGTMAVEQLDRIEDQGDRPPLIEVVGHTDLVDGQVVAVTVNDVVAAVAPAVEVTLTADGLRVLHALLMPDSFAADNDVKAYLVDGTPGAETLHPLAVTAG
jgi:hypothetical protein